MPALTRTRLSVLPALGALLTLLASPSQASMLALDNQALSAVTGQDGINIFVSLNAKIGKISWNDDGGSASVRNMVIDSGTLNTQTSGLNMCAGGPGTCYFNAGLGLMSANIPTLKVDVIKATIDGVQTQQLGVHPAELVGLQ
jgi:hypothetical protein